MANQAAQLRAQAQSIWPGATVVERGRRYIVHQHPTNPNRKMYDSGGLLHLASSPNTEIDTAWQATTGAWQWEMTGADYQVFARDTFNAGNLIEYWHESGEWVGFDPQSINWVDENNSRQQIRIKQAVTGVVNDDVLRFPNSHGSGFNFEYFCDSGRLQKTLEIVSAGDLPTPTVNGNTIWLEMEFSLRLSSGLSFWLDGVEWTKGNNRRVETGSNIECKSAAGDVLFWIRAPKAWDSSPEGNETTGLLQVRRQGGPSSLFITVRFPRAWVDAATFPIFLDPTVDVQVGAGADDAYQNFSTVDIAGNQVRWNQAGAGYKSGGARFTGVDIGNGPTIDVAYLTIVLYHSGYDDPNMTISAEDSNSGAAFTTSTNDISNRTLTTANVAWTETGTGGGSYNSPSLVSVIQELADSYDFTGGGTIVLIGVDIDGTVSCWSRSYDQSSSNAPSLHIEYTAGGGDPAPSVSDAVSVSESVSVTIAAPGALSVSVSESVSLAEAVQRLLTSFVNKTDAVAVAEAVARLRTSFVSKTEAVAVAEAVQRQRLSSASPSDTANISESVAVAVLSTVGRSEAIAVTENVSVTVVAVGATDVTTGDSVAVSESTTVTLEDLLVSVFEAIGVVDSALAVTEALTAIASEALSVAEAVARQVESDTTPTDAVGVAESVNVAIAEAPSAEVTVSDAVGVAESVAVEVALQVNASDSVAMTEKTQVIPGLPVRDLFNGSVNLQQLVAYNGSWSVVSGAFRILSAGGTLEIPVGTNGLSLARWTGHTFPSNQYAQVTIGATGISGNNAIGGAVRVGTTGGGEGYVIAAKSDGVYFIEIASGFVGPGLQLTSNPPAPGDVLQIAATGARLTFWVNGTLVHERTDTSISGGVPGLFANTEASGVRGTLDAFEAGEWIGPAVSDAVGVAESVQIELPDALQANASDAVGVAESAVAVVPEAGVSNVIVSDAVGVLDTPQVATDALVTSVSDAVAVAEDVSAETDALQAQASEAIAVSENVAAETDELLAAASDSIALAEAVSAETDALQVTVADTTSVGESVGISLPELGTVAVSVSDAVSVGESVEGETSAPQVAVSDTVAAGESVNITLPELGVVAASVSDAVGVSESTAAETSAPQVAVNDSVSVGESVSISLPEIGVIAITVSDAIAVGDAAQSSTGDLSVSAGDTVAVGESAAAARSGPPTLTVAVADTITTLDSVTLATDNLAIVATDAVGVTDSPTVADAGVGALTVIVSEAVTVGDTLDLSTPALELYTLDSVLVSELTQAVNLNEAVLDITLVDALQYSLSVSDTLEGAAAAVELRAEHNAVIDDNSRA